VLAFTSLPLRSNEVTIHMTAFHLSQPVRSKLLGLRLLAVGGSLILLFMRSVVSGRVNGSGLIVIVILVLD
jgi:hypothetical protein